MEFAQKFSVIYNIFYDKKQKSAQAHSKKKIAPIMKQLNDIIAKVKQGLHVGNNDFAKTLRSAPKKADTKKIAKSFSQSYFYLRDSVNMQRNRVIFKAAKIYYR